MYLEEALSPSSPFPVRNPNIVTTTILVPSILSIAPQPATAGAVITIFGQNAGIAGTDVIIGDAAPAARRSSINSR